MRPYLTFKDVRFGYGEQLIFDRLNLEVKRGELVALIGPNGAGKTTLLALASGTLRPTHGRICLDGQNLVGLDARRRAQRIALVPQALSIPFAFSSREIVALGRTPYLGRLGHEANADRVAIAAALERTGAAALADRCVLDLSAGERQRVILAMALAQQPELLLLDEPTANLDVTHQLEFLRLVRSLARAEGLTVVAAVHDLNLAALAFDRIAALADGMVVADGSPVEVLRAETIEAIYGARVRVVNHPTEPVPLVALVWPSADGRDLPVEPV